MQKIIRSAELTESFIEENCFIAEILNDSTIPEVSVAKARVLPGTGTELHSLNGTHELYYILSGSGEMEMDGKTQGIVRQGDLVCILKNVPQRIKNPGPEDLIFLCICSPRFVSSNYQSI